MSVIGLVGLGAGIAGKWSDKAKKLAHQEFKGSFDVTIGSAIAGIYGPNYQATFGPTITHVVDDLLFGLKSLIWGTGPYGAAGGLLVGIGGKVDFCHGPQIGITYDGPAMTLTRGITVTKSGNPFKKPSFDIGPAVKKAALAGIESGATKFAKKNLGLWGLEWLVAPDPVYGPAEVPAAPAPDPDAGTNKVVTILTGILNLVTAITQLVMHFKYPDYQRGGDEDFFSCVKILDLIVTELPTRLMAAIVLVEELGAMETGWGSWKKSGLDLLDDYKDLAVLLVGIPVGLVGAIAIPIVNVSLWIVKEILRLILEGSLAVFEFVADLIVRFVRYMGLWLIPLGFLLAGVAALVIALTK